ncbi:UNVERIFIED_CONTAM: hypothetical protein PYX00_009067 [Menopon gallinae]|uniref:DUF4729 domain-containing protein n=1 Tax=Menopon gallinae TaxID=328185 RepID=A0AAW2H9V2_9NEOP
MAVKYLIETEIRKLLQCSRCKKSATGPPVHICKMGHLECYTCFAKLSETSVDEIEASTDSEGDTDSSNHSCAICKEEVLRTRNLLAEALLVQLEVAKTLSQRSRQCATEQRTCTNCCYNIYSPQCLRYDAPNVAMAAYEAQTYQRYQYPCDMQQYGYQPPLDPYPLECSNQNLFYPDYDGASHYNGYRRDLAEARSRSNFGPQSSVLSLAGEPSKRPIRCPTHLCGRNIAVTALTSHFSFDHPDVPPVNVDFDVSSHLFVVPDVIPFNYGRCVAMLLIPNRLEPINSVSQSNFINSPKGKNCLPLVVMASRLDCVTNPQNANTTEENRAEMNQGDFRIRENMKSPLLVIWLAGIEANTSIFTTLQVTEKQTNIRSVVYTGPVTSLRSCQNTTKVFEQGDCLVIHSGMLENIIGDRGGFDLHVVVH